MFDAQGLLTWFHTFKRDLPWRVSPSPYRIWISEVMSQQTTLAVVVPYFERFVTELPDVEALASASEATLRRLWQGLGYYSRVRNLQKAAQLIVHERGGELPRRCLDWLSLPGCGPYTAAAVASIAAREKVAAVDGNVLRVMSRLQLIGDEIHRLDMRQKLAVQLTELMSDLDPGDFNQALMELGAKVCKPRSPLCLQCPIKGSCLSFQKGLTAEFPPPRKRRDKEKINVVALVVQCPRSSRFLIAERAAGLLAQTFGFPLLREDDWKDCGSQFSVECAPWRGRHQITHHAIAIQFAQANFSSQAEFKNLLRWLESRPAVKAIQLVGLAELPTSLTSSLDQKVATAAGIFSRERVARRVRLKN